MVGSAEAEGGDASEDKLDPGHDRQRLADYTVGLDDDASDFAIDALLEVKLQVHAHGDLGDQHEHDVGYKVGVDIRGELSTLVLVAKEVAHDGKKRAGGLHWNVPSRSYHLSSISVPGPPSRLGVFNYLRLEPYQRGK